jgi:hypothetical protein
MSDLFLEEYKALRATIRERGTARIAVFVGSLAVWGALATACVLVGSAPVFTLIPLVTLAAGFEAVFHIHVGVERIGRYLQVHAEDASNTVRWETTAMAFGRGFKAVTSDPLFTTMYLTAAFVNLVPALGEPMMTSETVTISGVHVLFAARVLLARRAAGTQRERDLERFRALTQRE